jgi:peroxiredoxin Q/BCP
MEKVFEGGDLDRLHSRAPCEVAELSSKPQLRAAFDPSVGMANVTVMVTPGVKIDLSFPVKAVVDGKIRECRFADLLAGETVVSVYMRNNTGSCDRQNAALIEVAAELRRKGVGLIALSRDTAPSHLRYASAKGIDYVLVSDPDDQFARATDSLVEKSMYGRRFMGPARAAYVLARDGTVRTVVPKVDAAEHAEQLRAAFSSR